MGETLRLATHVLCEADGAKGLPLKAHASYEPVVPRETNRLIYVAGADGLGQTIAQAAHRPQLYAALLGAAQTLSLIHISPYLECRNCNASATRCNCTAACIIIRLGGPHTYRDG